ncbi:MAG: cytochrome c oxidase accessory protein CcoG [Gammaproteobacteria bacterium]
MDNEVSLYQSAPRIHAREIDGLFSRMRKSVVFILLGIYYCFPWLTWDDRQAVLWDLPARKFYIFGLTFWPQDFIYMAWLLIIAGMSLFFFTALAGRLWCGYACPQTVWTQVFVWLERIAEGPRSKRLKLDKAPWSIEKALRRCAKQFLWITFSLWTGFIFVGYFTPVRELDDKIFSLSLGGWELFWVLFYSFATYGLAGVMREQVCKYMCPYARFQSAMFDHDSLIISYDSTRGEPRGSRSRKDADNRNDLGDCIDCTMCVQVCPTGIDIREGLQYECIACAACIDACNGIMDKMGYAPNLIKYTTENAMEGRKSRVFRLRTAIYGTILLALLIGIVGALVNRYELHLDVLRDRNALYRELSSGVIENVYSIKVVNKSERDHPLEFKIEGLNDVSIETDPSDPVAVAGEMTVIPVRIQANPQTNTGGGQNIVLSIHSEIDAEIGTSSKSRFYLPEK